MSEPYKWAWRVGIASGALSRIDDQLAVLQRSSPNMAPIIIADIRQIVKLALADIGPEQKESGE